MRFFIALEIPEDSKAELEQVQHALENLIPQINITKDEKLHLTIAFVGEQPDKLKGPLIQAIETAVDNIPQFSVTPAYIDAFPRLHHPHIIWCGVKGDIDKLYVLRERIKDNLEKLNLEMDERRFTPHITLGKVDNFDLPAQTEESLQRLMMQTQFKPIQIKSIKLFASTLDGTFHTHNTLAEIKLI